MRRHSVKGLYKGPGVWDLGGSLNELDAPGELSTKDVVECENWKVDKDGKSRIKRPGYEVLSGSFPDVNEPIVQVHEYEDPNGLDRKVVITPTKIIQSKEVIDVSRVYHDTDAYNSPFHSMVYFQGNLIAIKSGAGATEFDVLKSTDGETWTTLAVCSGFIGVGTQEMVGQGIIEFNNHLFISAYSGGTDYRVLEWDGSSWTGHQNASENAIASGFLIWDGRLWSVFEKFPGFGANHKFEVRHYNGASWSSITNYDTASDIDTGQDQNDQRISQRLARLFIWGGSLYLVCSVYVPAQSKWSFQVWKFKESTYDQFNKVYDSATDGEYYALSSIIEFDDKVYLFGADWGATAQPQSNDIRIFSSDDMLAWTKEADATGVGFPAGEVLFSGRIYIVFSYWTGSAYTSKLYYYDKVAKAFVLEKNMTDDAPGYAAPGSVASFMGTLSAAKWNEIFLRTVVSTEWTTISYNAYNPEPPAKVSFDGRLQVAGFGENKSLEGDTVQTLGIIAPTAAPSAAAGAAGNLTGDYQYAVTFMRSGNYPCESNPSPLSTVVSPSSQKVNLTSIPVSSDPKVNRRRIYRTYANGAILYWLADIDDNSTTTLEDNYYDSELGDEVSYDRLPPPKGTLFEVWDNKLWIAGNDEYPELLFFTNTGTAEEWSTSNFLNIKRRESSRIVQIKVFGDKLYVWKPDSWFEISKVGSSYYDVAQRPENFGTDAPWSITVCNNVLAWKSPYGIEVFNGSTCFRPRVSRLVRRTMASINDDQVSRCVGGYIEKESEYWLAIPTGTSAWPDKVVIWNSLTNNFTIYTFAKDVSTFAPYTQLDGSLVHLLGTKDGYLMVHDSSYTTDNGEIINAHFKTGWINVKGEREIWNIIRRLFFKYILPAEKDQADVVIGAGTGSKTDFSYTAKNLPIKKSSITIKYTIGSSAYEATDDGDGAITGTSCTGTVDYDTGAIALTFSSAPDNGTNVTMDYTTTISITLKIYRDYKKTAVATIKLLGSTPTTDSDIRGEILRRVNIGIRGYNVMLEFINNQDPGGDCRLIGWDWYFKRRMWKRTVKGD